jgi:hypothetical protein
MSDESKPVSRPWRPGWLSQRIAIGDIQSPLVRKAYDLWIRKKLGRRMPSRSELSPRDMAEFLRNVLIVKVLGGGEFEFRIVGDALVTLQGASFQGMNTAEIDRNVPGYGEGLREVYSLLCKVAEPLIFRGKSQSGAVGKPFFHETLLLPLGANSETVDHILAIGYYSFGEGGQAI